MLVTASDWSSDVCSSDLDIHIYQIVDEHVCEIVVKLSEDKVEEYLKFRKQIAHDRVDDYQKKANLKEEKTETTEIAYRILKQYFEAFTKKHYEK
jgi:hypothetical protein